MSSLMAAIALGAAPHWAAGSWELLPEEAGEVGAFTCADEPLHITLDEPAMRFHGERGDFAYSASLLALGEDWLELRYDGETRLTEAGTPVEWRMVFVDSDHFYWHRLDWPGGSRTAMRRRCHPEEWS